MNSSKSRLGKAYDSLYSAVCGKHPFVHPWHFQWLSKKALRESLERNAPLLEGSILDIGCGDKPYRSFFKNALTYTGLDIFSGPSVDIVVEPNAPWDIPSDQYDAVICTQVAQYAKSFELLFSEIFRVLKPGGILLFSVPFAYNEHDVADDYWRFTKTGLKATFEERYEIVAVETLGKAGTTLGTLWLNWINTRINSSRLLRLLRAPLLPVWMAFCFATNLSASIIDCLDITDLFYENVLLVARKKREPFQ